MKLNERLTHAWNAFMERDMPSAPRYRPGSSSSRPLFKSRSYMSSTSYVASIYNRIAMDVAMTQFKHVKVDPENEDVVDVKSGLNNCLSVEANIDQTHLQFIHDLVYSMFDEGVVAVVPIDTSLNPNETGGYDIGTLRVGKITQWYPQDVEVDVYNEKTGQNERITISKKHVAIVENPLYAVINDANSTLKRLVRKLSQLDNIEEESQGRLDLIISVPYGIKTDVQRKMAEARVTDIENQLSKSRNGIAYIDSTEKATQLNRPINSQLSETVEKLEQRLYNQLGLTPSIFNGTASETELKTYYNRSIDPIVEYIIAELTRKFITKTARTQGQKIVSYRDIFKTATIEAIANAADSLRRNYVATPNELRKPLNLRPSNDPRADELFNPNIADDRQAAKGDSSESSVETESSAELAIPVT